MAISHTLYVILSVTKDLKACTAILRHGDLEILHSVQNDRVFVIARLGTSRGNLLALYVILSETKDLLAGYALSMWVVAGRL